MKTALATIPRGESFKLAGYNWLVLKHRKTSQGLPYETLVLMREILEDRAFDKDNSNDWRKSSSRAYLNGEFLDKLVHENNDNDAPFLKAEIDLTAEDGLKDYGTTTDKVFLLTCDQYRRHRDIIEPLGDCWWTLTPYSTPTASYSYNVRFVNSGGTLYISNAYNGIYGLRPALLLTSDLLVSTDGEDETEAPAFGEGDINVLARAVRAVASHLGIDPDELTEKARELFAAIEKVGLKDKLEYAERAHYAAIEKNGSKAIKEIFGGDKNE